MISNLDIFKLVKYFREYALLNYFIFCIVLTIIIYIIVMRYCRKKNKIRKKIYINRKITDNFLIRKQYIKNIKQNFKKNSICVLLGENGVGKTQLVLKYIEDNSIKYDYILFINAVSEKTILYDYSKILDINFEIDDINKKFIEWFQNNEKILIIYDNVSNEETRKFILKTIESFSIVDNRNILITSTLHTWKGLITNRIGMLDRLEAYKYFVGRVNNYKKETVFEFVEKIYCFPLALDLICSYLIINKVSEEEFLKNLKDINYENSKTIIKSCVELIYSSKNISFNMFAKILFYYNIEMFPINSSLKQALSEELNLNLDEFENELNILKNNKLIQVENEFLCINKIVSDAILEKIDLKSCVHINLKILNKILESNLSNKNYIYYYVLPCAKYIQYNIKNIEIVLDKLYILLGKIYLYCGKYNESENNLNKGIRFKKERFGELHPELIDLYDTLGQIYKESEKYLKSEKCFEMSLIIKSKFQSIDQNEIVLAYKNLSEVYILLSKNNEAESNLIKAVTLIEKSKWFVEIDYSIYNTLAKLYINLEKFEEAEEYLNKVIEANKITKVKVDNIICVMGTLAELYQKQQKFIESEKYFLEILKIYDECLAKDNIEIDEIYNNLGCLYVALARFHEAETYFDKALTIRVAKYGTKYPKTTIVYNNLAGVYIAQRQYKQAELYLREAELISDAIYKNKYLILANTFNTFASLYKETNKLLKAEEYFKKSIDVFKSALELDNQSLANVYSNLGLILTTQNRFDEAEEFFNKALKIFSSNFGEDHQFTAIIYWNLANLYQTQNNLIKSEVYYLKAFKIFVEKLGKNHSYTMRVKQSIDLIKDRR